MLGSVGSTSHRSEAVVRSSPEIARGCYTVRRCGGYRRRLRSSVQARATSRVRDSPTHLSARRSAESSGKPSAVTPTLLRSPAWRMTWATRPSATTESKRSTRSPNSAADSRGTRRRCDCSPGWKQRPSMTTAVARGSTSRGQRSRRRRSTHGRGQKSSASSAFMPTTPKCSCGCVRARLRAANL